MKKLLLTLFLATSALAGDGAISLSPAAVMLRGDAGQSATQTLLLKNGTSRTMTFDLVAQDVVVRDGVRTFVEAGAIPSGIAATAVFSEKRVVVHAGESAPVTVTLTIPPNATNRAVIALFRGVDRIQNGSMTATASVGTLMTFALSDKVAMTTDRLIVQPQSPTSNLSISQTCTNAGTEPLVAKAVLAVIGADGKLHGKAQLPPRRLLPGERAELGTEYAAELAPGRYRVLLSYDYEGRALTQSTEIEVQ